MMKKKVLKHLKGDIKMFKKEAKEDKELMKKLKHEKKESKSQEAKEHKAGTKTSRKTHKRRESRGFKDKVALVMHEFKEGKLHSGSKKGPQVQNPRQALAIALSEARRRKK